MINENYIRWELSGEKGKMKLFARSITEAHKERTLKLWAKERVKNIKVVEREGVLDLSQWDITIPEPKGYRKMTVFASSEALAKKAATRQYKKLLPWQVMGIKVTQMA